ncbi:hypothetical protein [Streptomyces pseudogriseolus]|uniref:hypothetical protein n=1 Tax=Streptomyces pseudogriseolus TaxID=36817 RepID=UPI003660C038
MTDVATPGYGSRMPNQPKTPARQMRIGDEWYDFDLAAKAQGSERAAVIRAFIDWYIGKPSAELPQRPDESYWRKAQTDD